MKNDSIDILAQLLAAEEHSHLKDREGYSELTRALEDSVELQAEFTEAKAFLEKYPVLTQIAGLPQESRERIEKVLRAEMAKQPEGKVIQVNSWGMRKQFAWAAVLALLLAGISVISSTIIQNNDRVVQEVYAKATPTPHELFLEYAGQLAEGPMPLENRARSTTQLVSWLADRGAGPIEMPSSLAERDGMGCAYLDGPQGKVSLICFNTENGMVHLFVSDAEALQMSGTKAPQKMMVNDREAMEWHDEANAYLLITHEKDQKLPEVFL
ncbi:hypothetical protein P3T73_03910 [Kiritimatiellota bacterium B12222]|nr:hypothetical protein P3T73_03910 [Kiritimatiellota bacterium B12222]